MKPRFRVDGYLGRRLQDQGLSLPAIVRHARLIPGFFEQEKISVETEELFALWNSIGALSTDPAIGLKLGDDLRVEWYSALALAMLAAPTFREAVERAARYKRLTCPEEIEIVGKRGEHHVRFHWLLAEDDVPFALIDLCFAWIMTISRRGTGTALRPQRVELRRKSTRATMYRRHFGCPIVFGAAHDALVFRSTDLALPFLTHNADLAAIVSPHLEAELDEADSGVLLQVKRTIKRLLAGRRPDLEDVAQALGMTARTLQRRLAVDGHTYGQGLEQARRELSHRYLLDGDLELNEAAFLLGYTDASSFFRAFRQWEGTSPGRWREDRLSRPEAC